MPRFRLPFAATWTRALDTSLLERREGKQESYWPVGVAGETFMCLILKVSVSAVVRWNSSYIDVMCRGGKNTLHSPDPSSKNCLSSSLSIAKTRRKRLLKSSKSPLLPPSILSLMKTCSLAREGMLLDILRDSLGDELTTDDISRRELALDKELIQLIQNACKNDRLARALDLAKLLHHTASFDMAVKVAGFYHLIGLQEKMEALKEDRLQSDRLADARETRRQRARDLAVVPAPRTAYAEPARARPFQDFRPPPVKHRPGLERATPIVEPSKHVESSQLTDDTAFGSSLNQSVDDYSLASPGGKRKRGEDVQPVREYQSPGVDNTSKRRAYDEPVPLVKTGTPAGRTFHFFELLLLDILRVRLQAQTPSHGPGTQGQITAIRSHGAQMSTSRCRRARASSQKWMLPKPTRQNVSGSLTKPLGHGTDLHSSFGRACAGEGQSGYEGEREEVCSPANDIIRPAAHTST